MKRTYHVKDDTHGFVWQGTFLIQGVSFEPCPQSLIVDIQQDENLDQSIMYLLTIRPPPRTGTKKACVRIVKNPPKDRHRLGER
ncbi:hypothetical protein K443DRAFT_110048 [Laccaria amethystina LaAM-08-1]|uniref:Uncharacterized protein n=1 Tax=Laccaria amethystina LaAM-08-1 TaxID=1095629 RepID=A0A0C9XER1_9AGAR|nr:hypothetical protein K443DRAFT_110048 [Laccaria amethystina LaAM-08-1]